MHEIRDMQALSSEKGAKAPSGEGSPRAGEFWVVLRPTVVERLEAVREVVWAASGFYWGATGQIYLEPWGDWSPVRRIYP